LIQARRSRVSIQNAENCHRTSLSFTIRPNTAGSGWSEIEDLVDVPVEVAQVRATGQPKLIDGTPADVVRAWIELMGWEKHDAPVFLEPLE
jgi:hypothetical protein